MYLRSSSATQHIFFPPRLQVVAFEQHPDGLSPSAGNQLALDGLLGHQTHGPTRPPFRRFAAGHGDDTLLLGSVQKRLGAGPLLVVEGAVQATTVVTVSDLADGFRGEGQRLRDSWRGGSLGEQPERESAQDDAHLLNSGSQQPLDAGEILRLDLDGDWASRHTP
jgi:hypothetical protein